jgi:xanthine dehydrogenase accessory factor
MKELETILRILRTTTTRGVLATLVKVEGSSYRKVGARLLSLGDSHRVGSISGGCLEEDLLLRARRVLASGNPEVVVYDTTDENDLVWGVGLGCHGIVRVVLEPIQGVPSAWQTVLAAWGRREGAVAGISFGGKEGSSASTGTQFSLAQGAEPTPDVPEEVISAARSALAERRSRYITTGADNLSWLLEYLPPSTCLAIFGAGDDARPLCRMAKELGWRVVIVDPRSAFATPERFPEADQVTVAAPDDLSQVAFDDWTVGVVMTHHYRFDMPLLRTLLPRRLKYLGLLGPKKRAERILADLRQGGADFDAEMLSRLHAPVGLDLGGGTPEEVALAIIAEIQSVLNQRDARALRERTRPIHG